MGCVTASRVFIVLFNILFIILGLIFFAGGLFLKFGSSVYQSALDSVKNSIQSALSGLQPGTTINLDLGSIIAPVAYAFIGFGLFILVICFFACCGGCYKFRVLLMMYNVLAIIILAAEIVLVILILGTPSVLQTPLASALKSGIQSDYQDITGTNINSLAWNLIMQQFQCCGANDYTDFTGASQWNVNKYVSVSCASCTLVTPLACCKALPTSSANSGDLACALSPLTTTSNYYNTGCVNKIWNDYLIANNKVIGGGFAGLAVFQLLLIILAFIIFCGTKKGGDDDEEKPLKKNKVAPLRNNGNNSSTGNNNGRPSKGQKKNKVSPARF